MPRTDFQGKGYDKEMKMRLLLLILVLFIAVPVHAKKNINGVQVLTEIEELVDPSHAAIMVVDMQNEWVSTEGAVVRKNRSAPAKPEKHQLVANYAKQVEKLRPFLAVARKYGVPVSYCEMIMHNPAGLCLRSAAEMWSNRKNPKWEPYIIEGSWGAQTVKELAPRKGEILVRKIHGDAFSGTSLDAQLKEKGIKSLILTGTATGGCVWATAIGALEIGYYPIWVKDCVNRNDETFKLIGKQYPIFTSDEIIKVWERKALTKSSKLQEPKHGILTGAADKR